MKASLISREMIADSIELVGRANYFDAMLVLVGCDKTIPGGVMALVVILWQRKLRSTFSNLWLLLCHWRVAGVRPLNELTLEVILRGAAEPDSALGQALQIAITSAADITSQYAYKDGHVTVVMFEASWCHFCKQQKPILTSLASEFRGKVYNQFLDAEAPVNSAMVTAFNVDAYPVTVIFNDQGHVTAKFLGLTDPASIRAAINQALSESVGTVSPAA
jgi:thiol-disulfide isomerase/thioredoxin